ADAGGLLVARPPPRQHLRGVGVARVEEDEVDGARRAVVVRETGEIVRPRPGLMCECRQPLEVGAAARVARVTVEGEAEVAGGGGPRRQCGGRGGAPPARGWGV